MSYEFRLILILFQIFSFYTCLTFQKNIDYIGMEEEENEELSDDIIILHTNDIHCSINDNIGYDGLMLYKKILQKKYKYILTIDIGDHFQGETIGLLSKGLEIINIMNKVGYNISIIGNHEFDYGLKELNERDKQLEYGYICANFCYRKNKESIFPPSKIIEIGGKKIGFIGVITPQTLIDTNLHNIVDEEGNMVYDFLGENEGKDLYDKIQEYIDKLKLEGVNYIILLDHLGNEDESPAKFNSRDLLSHISGIDAMIDGHSHKVYNYTSKDKDGKFIPMAQAGTKFSNIGLLKILNNGTIISEIISEIPEPEDKEGAEKVIRNKKERWVDIEMKNFLLNISDNYSEQLNQIYGISNFDLIINTEPLGDFNKQKIREEECTLGNLVTDAIRDLGKSDISMVSGGSIRDDLIKGNITLKKILNILPYSSEIIVKEISGQDILDALELGMSFLPQKSPKFLQVSGMSFNVDINIKSTVEFDENGRFIRVKGKRRVNNVKIGEEKLDLNKKYTISFNEYIGYGGDGYSMFQKYKFINDTLKKDNEALITYIKDVLKGEIPDYYRKTQGRIIINSEVDNNNNDSNNTLTIIIIILIFIIIIIIFALIIIILRKRRKNDIDYTRPSNYSDLDSSIICDSSF